MKKIAMLNCLKANDVCTGAGCLKAFYSRTGGFAEYGDEQLQLMAMARCSGCDKTAENDPGMMEKLERLVSVGTEIVHIGVCAAHNSEPCPTMQTHARWLEEHGIRIIWRTH